MCACFSFWKWAAVSSADAEQQSTEQSITAAAAWRSATATATSSTTTAAAAPQYPTSTANHRTAATVHATGNEGLGMSGQVKFNIKFSFLEDFFKNDSI